jgi:hypothetical protein
MLCLYIYFSNIDGNLALIYIFWHAMASAMDMPILGTF